MNELFKSFVMTYRASRSLKYGGYFITILPFLAILYYNGFINSPWALLYLLPLVPAFAGGFMWNAIGDADKDPKSKNPVTQGLISVKFLYVTIALLYLLSILFLLLIYSSFASLVSLLLLLLLAAVYSGFKLRMKESILGPVVASFGFFVLPSIMLLLEFNYFSLGTVTLLIGLFVIYFAHEIKHTIIEYDLDLSYDCRTFAVIVGKKNANIAEYASLILGFILLTASIYYLLPNSYMISTYYIPTVYVMGVFIIFFLLSMFFTLFYGFKTKFDQKGDVILNMLPYIASRTCYITIGLFLLNLPMLIIIFALWLLFTDKYL